MTASTEDLPDVLVLSSCRNEEEVILQLCLAIDRINYPPQRIQVVLIDDGSTDQTATLMESFASKRPGWSVLKLEENLGKADALNAALEMYPFGEFIFVFDADHQPRQDVIRRAIDYFQDPVVAGVSGRTVPLNPLSSLTAYYSTVEGLIHQMVTMRAKDRLELAPALLGSNCAYRRSILMECGGFRHNVLLEDTDLTLALYLAGFKVRFIDEMVSYHHVTETIAGYVMQHMRWARGFTAIAQHRGLGLLLNPNLKPSLRLELFLFSTGYLDRLALVSAVILAAIALSIQHPAGVLIGGVVFASIIPAVQILLLFFEQRLPLPMWIRFPLIPLFFLLDMYTAAKAAFDGMLRKQLVWSKTARSRDALSRKEVTVEQRELIE